MMEGRFIDRLISRKREREGGGKGSKTRDSLELASIDETREKNFHRFRTDASTSLSPSN